VLTTVDTVFREQEFARYVADFERLAARGGGLMGVTDYVDDEKPLYVESPLLDLPRRGIRETRNEDLAPITGFFDEPKGCRYVSAGIYGLPPVALDTLRACIERGESRMRNFQRALVADGVALWAWPFTQVFDIDHVEDIKKANED
jgi:NDP-sugar pyrophosphorylase family protein